MDAMSALDPRRLLWSTQRAFLRHGALAWISAAAVLALLLLFAASLSSSLRLARATAELDARVAALRLAESSRDASGRPVAAVVPLGTDTFATNRRLLAALEGTGFAPERIVFKFEPVGETGFVRQVAVFSVRARWSEVAGLLDALQRADRSLYIARLRLSRDDAADPLVGAEIQLAATLADVAADTPGGTP
jgi:hypothetical protein